MTVRVYGNLGSDEKTRIYTTSSGDATFNLDDKYVITDDDADGFGTPSLAHLFWNKADTTNVPGTEDAGLTSDDDLYYEWAQISVPAGGRVIFMYYGIQDGTRADTNSAASDLLGLTGSAKNDITAGEEADIVNWDMSP